MDLTVSVVSPTKVIYKGPAKSVIVPGEAGVFEMLPFHKPVLSRLISGVLVIDGREVSIRRGVIKAERNIVTIIVEES